MARKTTRNRVDRVGSSLHIDNHNNPHKVTAEQVGTLTKEEILALIGDFANSFGDADDELDSITDFINSAIDQALVQANFYTDEEIKKLNNSLTGYIDGLLENLDYYTQAEVNQRDQDVIDAIMLVINNLDYYTTTEIQQRETSLQEAIEEAYETYVAETDLTAVNTQLNNALDGKVSLDQEYQSVEITEANGILVTGYNAVPDPDEPVARINLRGSGVTSGGASYAGIHIQKNENPSGTPDWQSKFWADIEGNLFLKGNIQMDDGSIFVGTPEEGVVVDNSLGVLVNSDSNGVRAILNASGSLDVDYSGLTIQKNEGTLGSPDWKTQFYADQSGNVYMLGTLQPGSILTGSPTEGVIIHPDLGVLVNSDTAGVRILLNATGVPNPAEGVDVNYAGITIQKNEGTLGTPDWNSQFFVDQSGNVYLKGTLQPGSILLGDTTTGVFIDEDFGVLTQNDNIRISLSNVTNTLYPGTAEEIDISGIFIQKNVAPNPGVDPAEWELNFYADIDGNLFLRGNVQLQDGSILVGSASDPVVFISQETAFEGIVVTGDTVRTVIGEGEDDNGVTFTGISVQENIGTVGAPDWLSNFHVDVDGNVFFRGEISTTAGNLGGDLDLTGLLSIGDPASIFIGADITTYDETLVQTYSDTIANDTNWTNNTSKTFTTTGFDSDKYTDISFNYSWTAVDPDRSGIAIEGWTGTMWKNIGSVGVNDITTGSGSFSSTITTIGYSQVRLRCIHDGTMGITNISAQQYDPILYISNGKIMQKISPNLVVPLGSTSSTIITGSTGGGVGSSAWLDITGKPFTTVSSQFNIVSEELQLPQDLATTNSPTFAGLTLNGNLTQESGYFWNKVGVSYLSGGAIVGSSAVPVYDFEVDGNSHFKTGWVWIEDSYLQVDGYAQVADRIAIAGSAYGASRIGNNELQVSGSVDVSGSIGFIYDTANQQSSWRMFQGGDPPLLIMKNFNTSEGYVGVVDIRGAGSDVTSTTIDSEATLTLYRGNDAESNSEYIDFYNNGYPSSREFGIAIQKRGTGEWRRFLFGYSDNSSYTNMWTVNPPDDGNNIEFEIDALFSNEAVSQTGFNYGFAQSGTLIDFANDYIETTDLTVRGRMTVYELIINQIRATNGSLWVTSAAKVESVTALGGGFYRCFMPENQFVPFFVDDLLRAQRFTGVGTYTIEATVTAVENGSGAIGSNTPARYFEIQLDSGTAPTAGVEFVRTGSTSDTDRQGAIYLTADEAEAPYIDIYDGMDSHADFGASSILKVRLGDLTNAPALSNGTATTGYGLYSENVFLEGTIVANDGKIGSWELTDSRLTEPVSGTGLYIEDDNVAYYYKGVLTTPPSSPDFSGLKIDSFNYMADLGGNPYFHVGNSTNWLAYNGTDLELKVANFDLITSGLEISSSDPSIIIGTGGEIRNSSSTYSLTDGGINLAYYRFTLPMEPHMVSWGDAEDIYIYGDHTLPLSGGETYKNLNIHAPNTIKLSIDDIAFEPAAIEFHCGSIEHAFSPEGLTLGEKLTISTGGMEVDGESDFNDPIILPNYTTTQMNALTPKQGMVVMNTTINRIAFYSGTGWKYTQATNF